MINKLFYRLGPGVIFAANAVGVSHLVQSTRAGAGYGLALVGFILLVTAIKYPLFRFACLYSAASGKTLLEGYRSDGPYAAALLIISVAIDMFIATAAVSLVTAGIVKNVLGIDVSNLVVVATLIGLVFFLLISAGYNFFEKLVIGMVIIFTILTIAAAGIAVPTAVAESSNLFPELDWSPTLILFLIAMAGWMPNPPSAAFFLSAWTAKRKHELKEAYTRQAAMFDFNIGYTLTIVIALAFVLLGAVLLYLNGIVAETNSSVEFAGVFMRLFTESYGSWAVPVVGTATIVVMFSTLLTLFDGAPRVMRQAFGKSEDNNKVFLTLFAVQAAGVLLIIQFFGSSFASFINFATSISFATAPFIAFFNHRAIMSKDVPEGSKPGLILRYWSIMATIILMLIGAYYYSYQLGFV